MEANLLISLRNIGVRHWQKLAAASRLELASLFAVDPLVDGGRPETPELSYLNARNLPTKNHALKRARVDSKHGGSGMTV